MDQIEVSHPLAKLGIGEPLVLLGRSGDGFGQQRQVLGEDGQFAGAGAFHLAFNADDVAQVEAFRQLEVLVADLGLADHRLDGAGPIADLQPVNLARGAAEHDSPGRADLGAMLFGLTGLGIFGRHDADFALLCPDFADRLMIVEASAPGIDAQFAYFAQFFSSGGFERGITDGGLRGGCVVHSGILRKQRHSYGS